jgi:DNA-binding NarL/FixJ family response regulator
MSINKGSVALIVDDHSLFSDSFASLIDKLGIFEEVRTLNDDTELFRFLVRSSYNIIFVFLDYYLKERTSLTLMSDIRKIVPNVRIVIVSSVTNSGLVHQILRQHPNGFINKGSNFEVIKECFKTVERKEQYLCPIITSIAATAEEIVFTRKEIEILHYIRDGLSIEQTASVANLSRHTVVSHRRNMMSKANCKSVTELLRYCHEKGIL